MIEADRLMDSAPDSAYGILLSIAPDRLKTPEDRAFYALLLTQGADKNYATLSDSLITGAVEYFEEKDDRPALLKSRYYQGRAKFLNQDFPSALLSFQKSKEIGEELEEDFWTGMSCRGISDIYHVSFNGAEEVRYALKEVEYIKRSGRQPYINYALRDLARAYSSNTDYDNSHKIALEALDSARVHKDPYLEYIVKDVMGTNYVHTQEYTKALEIFKELATCEFSQFRDSAFLSLTYSFLSDSVESTRILKALGDNHDEDMVLLMSRSNNFQLRDKYKEAFNAQIKIGNYSDSLFRKRISMDLTSNVIDYYKLTSQISKTKSHNARLRSIIIICVCFIILFLSFILFYVIYRNQKRAYGLKIKTVKRLHAEISRHEERSIRTKDIIKYLISAKYEYFEKMCEFIYLSNDSDASKIKIADSIIKLIASASRDSQKIVDIERMVNETQNNIIRDLKTDYPDLNESEYRLFLYLLLGFQPTTITILCNYKNVKVVYDKKRRLKEKIKKREEKAEKYLNFF